MNELTVGSKFLELTVKNILQNPRYLKESTIDELNEIINVTTFQIPLESIKTRKNLFIALLRLTEEELNKRKEAITSTQSWLGELLSKSFSPLLKSFSSKIQINTRNDSPKELPEEEKPELEEEEKLLQ